MSDHRSRGESGPRRAKVVVAAQFRERGNMTYELDCAGVHLIVRVFAGEGEGWRLEARTSDREDASVVSGAAPSRREALAEVAAAWRGRADAVDLPEVDWDAVATALGEVRAI